MFFTTDKERQNRLVYIDVNQDSDRESLNFSMRNFNRTTFKDSFTLFDNVNAFLETLPVETTSELFELYAAAKDDLDQIKDHNRLHSVLSKKIKKIFELIKYEDIYKWFNLNRNINIPADLKESFDGEDNELTKQLTYLRSDYFDLVVLSTLLKFAAPIFGVYLDIVDKEVGSKFKEHRTFGLLYNSNIVKYQVFKRLEMYINASIEKEKRKNQSNLRTNSSIFGGLGTEELPIWLLAKTCVRKLMLYEETSDNSIIASVYHATEQHISGLDKSFGGSVTKKKAPFGDTEGDKTSLAENYRIKQSISDGDLAVLSIYTDRLEEMVTKVDPTINLNLLKVCMKNINKNSNMDITTHQMTLAQWVLSKAISPRGIPALKKSSILNALAGTQALLWHWGFEELAMLVTCTEYHSDEMIASGTTRVDNKTVQHFNTLYPHHQIKSKTKNTRNTNPALKAINLMTSLIVSNSWYSSAPFELDELNNVNSKNRVIYPSSDIAIQLTELIKKLN